VGGTMTAYEKYFGSIEKMVETMTVVSNMTIPCPSDFGLEDVGGKGACYDIRCTDCWKRALKREVEE